MLLFTILATLSKEHGITLPFLCLLWDFFTMFANINESIEYRRVIYNYAVRLLASFIGVFCIGTWRLSKNGSTEPDFVCEQNPAACQENFIKRFLYLNYLWVYNFWLLLLPDALSPDRSGESIPMFHHPKTDPRLPAIFLMWIILVLFLFRVLSFIQIHTRTNDSREVKVQPAYLSSIIVSFLWMIVPFFMSSNVMVYVGFVVADRTLYLPSFGFCLLVVQLLPRFISSIVDWVLNNNDLSVEVSQEQLPSRSKTLHIKSFNIREGVYAFVLIVILVLYTKKLVRQTKRWSDPVLLWGEAYRLYPSSCINGKEYGMALVNAQRPKDAIPVLLDMSKREMANRWFTRTVENFRKKEFGNMDAESEDPLKKCKNKLGEIGRLASIVQTRFKLVTAMGNVGRCDEARRIIDDGIKIIEASLRDINEMKVDSVIRQNEDVKDSIHSIEDVMITNKAYMLVSKSRCAQTLLDMAKFSLAAVQLRSGMDYVLEHAKIVNELIENTYIPLEKVIIVRTVSDDGQSAQVSFAAETR
jgi:hypothetical protein